MERQKWKETETYRETEAHREKEIERDRVRERLREAEMKTERGRDGEGRDHASLESWAVWSLTHISSEQPCSPYKPHILKFTEPSKTVTSSGDQVSLSAALTFKQ